MPSYTLATPIASDILRLAEIQQAGFKDEPVTLAAHANVSKEDYIAWASKAISQAGTPPGCKVEFVCAKDMETGEIVGWAEWAIPLDEGEKPEEGGEKEEIPYPQGGNEEIWHELVSAIAEYEKRTMGDRKHWSLHILVVDPAHQRRGIGTAIVSDGIKRAHAQGLPLFVSASQTGKLLYKSLGFEIKFDPFITSAKIQATMMAKDFPLSQI